MGATKLIISPGTGTAILDTRRGAGGGGAPASAGGEKKCGSYKREALAQILLYEKKR